MTAYNIHELPNATRGNFGFGTAQFFDGAAGKFIVMECCSYDDPYEIASFEHDGSAASRSKAYNSAQLRAGVSQQYDGSQCDYNVYEVL